MSCWYIPHGREDAHFVSHHLTGGRIQCTEYGTISRNEGLLFRLDLLPPLLHRFRNGPKAHKS